VPGKGHALKQVNISGELIDGHLDADIGYLAVYPGQANAGKNANKNNDNNQFGQGEA
jgi:hypothetical protein